MVNVADGWELYYVAYVLSFIAPVALRAKGNALLVKSLDNVSHDPLQDANRVALAAVNKLLDEGGGILRRGIKGHYKTLKNVSHFYVAYGMTKIGSSHKFTVDNDKRKEELKELLKTMKKPNDPFANDPDVGLAFWEPLIAQHATLWAATKTLSGGKTDVSDEKETARLEALTIMRRLLKQVKLDYQNPELGGPGANLDAVLRKMGWLMETLP